MSNGVCYFCGEANRQHAFYCHIHPNNRWTPPDYIACPNCGASVYELPEGSGVQQRGMATHCAKCVEPPRCLTGAKE